MLNASMTSFNRKSAIVKYKKYSRLFLLLLIVAMSVWVWKHFLEDRFIPKRFGVVEQGQIYRSGRLNEALIEDTLKQYRIAEIIDLTGHDPGNAEQQAEIRASQQLGIERIELSLHGDGTGDIRNYAQAIARIDEATHHNKPILVHCAAGTQRTGGVIAAYRLLVQNKATREVYQEMTEYDWRPQRDQAVLQYLNTNLGKLAELLVEKGVLFKVLEPLPQLAP